MPTHRVALAAAVLTAALATAGCSQDNPVAEEGAEVRGGAIGPDEMVTEDLSVLQVQLEYPLDGVYEPGEDASLFLGIANTGNTEDDLVDVRGPDFADAEITVDGEPGVIRVTGDDNVYVGAEGGPTITLVDLERSLRSSQSIPVTLVFEEAGEVTLDAPVAAEGQNPEPTYDFPDPAEDPTEG
ncbi:UNVERIFIED_ORG: copper chaperone PCu(A)C [Bacillus sp. AZ43]